MISQERLKELLHYDPETGLFTWAASCNTRLAKGSVAGHRQRDGYIVIKLDGESYRAHRLAFLYIDGTFPEIWVDHINGVRNDNRWGNLRKASIAENMFNAGKAVTNKSGVKGVYWSERERKWKAKVCANRTPYHLGTFPDLISAELAVTRFRNSVHGEFSNHGTKPSFQAAMRAQGDSE